METVLIRKRINRVKKHAIKPAYKIGEKMQKLYMFYIGGNAGASNIEVHDVQFVVCEDYKQAIPTLKSLWFGDADKIHIDGYQPMTWADGYDIEISDTAVDNAGERLYFVNVGGYQKDDIKEAHAFALFVAKNPEEAKEKAKAQLLVGFEHQHKDNLKDVDNLLELNEVNGKHIKLTQNPNGKPAEIEFQGYMPI